MLSTWSRCRWDSSLPISQPGAGGADRRKGGSVAVQHSSIQKTFTKLAFLHVSCMQFWVNGALLSVRLLSLYRRGSASALVCLESTK